MSKTRGFLLAASVVLALAFTFSCTSSDDKLPCLSCEEGGTVTYGGQTYKTVVIGTQTWMAENLNYAVEGSKCYGEGGKVYDDDWNGKTLSPAEVQANCTKYGRLYDWSKVMGLPSNCVPFKYKERYQYNNDFYRDCSDEVQPKHKGICPSGWHIPSDAEWNFLEDYFGGSVVAGTYGFSVKSGGCGRFDGSSFYDVDSYDLWWSTGGLAPLADLNSNCYREYDDTRLNLVDEGGYIYFCSRYNYHNDDVCNFDYGVNQYGGNIKLPLFSVRCVQDSDEKPSSLSAELIAKHRR